MQAAEHFKDLPGIHLVKTNAIVFNKNTAVLAGILLVGIRLIGQSGSKLITDTDQGATSVLLYLRALLMRL